MKAFLIELVNKLKENLFSKKFWALILATVLLWVGKIDAGAWWIVGITFIGADAVQKGISAKLGA